MYRIAVAYKKQSGGRTEAPYLFRTYDHQRAETILVRNPGPAQDILIRDVARATSAAPTYFKTMKILGQEFQDGGFGANNPSELAFVEVRNINNGQIDALNIMVSIGTGINTDWSRFGPGRLGRLLTLFNAAKKWASESHRTHETMLSLTNHGKDVPYYRINVEDGIGSMRLDECKADRNGSILNKIKRRLNIPCPLEMSTLQYITEQVSIELGRQETQEALDECAQRLVESRRLRSRNQSRWERQVLCTRFKCPQAGEGTCDLRRGHEFFLERDKFQAHIREDHPALAGDLEAVTKDNVYRYEYCRI